MCVNTCIKTATNTLLVMKLSTSCNLSCCFIINLFIYVFVCSPELVDPDFNLEIEVYCSLPPEEPVTKTSTPIKMLRKLKNRVRKRLQTAH